MPRRLRVLIRAFRRALRIPVGLLFAALLWRIVMTDRVPVAEFLFYVPAVLLVPVLLGATLLVKLRWAWRLAALLAGGLLGLWALAQDQPLAFRPVVYEGQGTADFRLVAYNVKSYSWGSREVHATIKELNPDVLCLIEGSFSGRRPEALAKALGPDYHWAVGPRVSIASRLPIVESATVVRTRSAQVLRAELQWVGRPIAVYAVDINPPLRRRREESFDELRAVLEREGLPMLVAGDFNAPRGSALLASVRTNVLHDAVTTASPVRYLATWPTKPFPLWQLDHAFVSKEFEALRARLPESLASDHRPVVVDVLFKPR